MGLLNGPKLQLPAGVSNIIDIQQDGEGRVTHMTVAPEWQQFFNVLQKIAFYQSRSGASADKPNVSSAVRYIGMPYYDTSLNANLHLTSTSPDIWTGTFSRHKSSSQNATTTTFTPDTELTYPVLAGDEFIGRMYLDVGAALGATGIKVSVNAPAGSSSNVWAGIITDAISAGEVALARSDVLNATLDFTAAGLGNCSNGGMEVMYHITIGPNAGNVTLQFAQSTASTTPLTVRVGSQERVDKTA